MHSFLFLFKTPLVYGGSLIYASWEEMISRKSYFSLDKTNVSPDIILILLYEFGETAACRTCTGVRRSTEFWKFLMLLQDLLTKDWSAPCFLQKLWRSSNCWIIFTVYERLDFGNGLKLPLISRHTSFFPWISVLTVASSLTKCWVISPMAMHRPDGTCFG